MVVATEYVCSLVNNSCAVNRIAGHQDDRIKNSNVEYLPATWIDMPDIAPFILVSDAQLSARIEANESVFAAENSTVLVMSEPQWFYVQAVNVRCEIIQADHLSRLIGTIWINRLFAMVIVINCWPMPIVRLVCRHHRNPALKRVLEMITDALMNVAYDVVIPYAILYPYQRDFNTTTRMFDGTVYYQDGWFATTTRNLQQLFISSWFNFICTIGPGFSMLSCMSTIKFCVHPQNNRVVGANAHGMDTLRVLGRGIRIRNAYLRLTKVASVILSSAGLFVLIIHLHATLVANLGGNSGCLLELRPWFKTKYTCVVLEASCTRQGVNAPQLALEDAVSEMDPNGIRSLVLSHCPQIEMPTQIRALLGLEQLKIYNSTIKTWEMDAAIDASTKPGLQFVYIIETNMSGIPPALLHRDLPLRLTDIEFSGTNLTRIPADLHEYWSHVQFLCLEASPGITEIPPSTAQMPSLSQLNLAGNVIAAVPDNQFVANAFYSVNLGGNPLHSLPIELGFTLLLHDIRIQHTKIASLPLKWFQEPPPSNIWGTCVIIMAGDSPLCDKLFANETDVVEGSTVPVPVNRTGLNTFIVDGYLVDCTSMPLQRFYPVEYERAWRQKNL
ncbi:hypothetical protein Poli38472_013478 [Pythium oligandrum]|uniref:Leucine-rich repeat domain, L domain-like n=1 Tax=Pythium oligandrum TaxID=41045 RepID=A0A8K1FEJ4_PYTOL|nr:hypothetical protein Poli38472_013478 [Pythium oligandrum]|eukprot:TMW58004.1 hypothetical protein Poli38472_013478 [Pythium oligandrum]